MNRNLLLMLVCALPVCCAFCACAAEPQTEQDKAVAEIKKLGGKVQLDEKSPGKPVIGVFYQYWRWVTDAGLEHTKGLTQLRTLSLSQTRITDAGLEHLKGLPQLQSLNLGGTKVSDAGLEHLKALTQLQSLDLGFTKVTDFGLNDLRKALPNLTIER